MTRLLLGSYNTKHFHPKLMDFIRFKEDDKAIQFISSAAEEYKVSRLTDNTGSTLLHHAVKDGSERIVSYLVTSDFNVNAVDHEGNTPLVLAVLGRRVTVTEILLNANANIYVRAGNTKSLADSVFDGTINCYSHIIEMFMHKVISKYTELDLQAKVLMRVKCPVYYALSLDNPAITKLMLRNGCAVNYRESRHGYSALHKAVYLKEVEHVKLLLEHGADVNVKDKGGKIAWRCAPTLDGDIVELEVLRWLLDRKPTLRSLTKRGRMQMYELFVLGSETAVSMILHSSVDFSGKDNKGDTVFHYLAMNRNLSGMKLLPDDQSYNMEMRNQAKLTALHVTAMNGNVGAMRFLLNSGARIEEKTRDTGITPLLFAIKARKNKCVRLLLEYGANAQFVTLYNKTVFDMVQDPNDPIVRTLLAHLAIIKSSGKPILPLIHHRIDNCQQYKKQFLHFEQQLDQMKRDKIDKSLTLFELLVQTDTDIEKHVRSEEVQMKIKSQNNDNYDPYYRNLIQRRVKRAITMNELFG